MAQQNRPHSAITAYTLALHVRAWHTVLTMNDDRKPTVMTLVPRTPSVPAVREQSAISQALESCGVSRKSIIKKLAEIAEHGQKVVVKEERGVVTERTITYDPATQIKALMKLSEMMDRAEGLVEEETATFTRKRYR
jgi:hypothetical protein